MRALSLSLSLNLSSFLRRKMTQQFRKVYIIVLQKWADKVFFHDKMNWNFKEMGAKMPSDSYFPVHYFTRIELCDGKMLNGGHSYHGFSSLLLANQHLGFNKEMLKQIMLKHEAVFRDQILELHRLYRRHKELMLEMKKIEFGSVEYKLKKFGRKVLDLELPADAYLDSEEEEKLPNLDQKISNSMASGLKTGPTSYFYLEKSSSRKRDECELEENRIMVVQALPCFINYLSSLPAKKVHRSVLRENPEPVQSIKDINLNFMPPSSHGEEDDDNALIQHVLESNEVDKKQLLHSGCHIDLNLSIDLTDIELEAPTSPENKECTPPRGVGSGGEKSEENGPNKVFQKSRRLLDDENKEEEVLLRNLAAEAIVSISSSSSRSHSQIRSPPCGFESLHCLVGIVCSGLDDMKNENGNENRMDFFEEVTLKLTETKVEENWPKNYNENRNDELIGDVLFEPCQQRKGRLRRGKNRRDFQTEILPSLVSLSRYEVTADLQTIEGLITEGASSAKNRGRKRQSFISSSNVITGPAASRAVAKQISSNCEPGIEEKRSVVYWGKINRRPRGPRFRATNPKKL